MESMMEMEVEAGNEIVLSNIALNNEERQKCEVWTRVMGYHRPVASFNRGKQGEYHERKCFDEPSCC